MGYIHRAWPTVGLNNEYIASINLALNLDRNLNLFLSDALFGFQIMSKIKSKMMNPTFELSGNSLRSQPDLRSAPIGRISCRSGFPVSL